MIRFHPNIPLMDVARALEASSMILLPTWDGGALIVRREDAAKERILNDEREILRIRTESPERQGTVPCNILPRPKRPNRIVGVDWPNPRELEDT